jgi:phosphatidate cytidylyltransferase
LKMEKALKQRLATGLILAPIAMAAIVALPTWAFALLFALIIALGGWEWGGVVGAPAASTRVRLLYTVFLLLLAGLCWYLMPRWEALFTAVMTVTFLWWLVVLYLVLTYPRTISPWATTAGKVVAGVFILVPAWLAIIGLHASGPEGPYLVLYLFLLIWIADSAAYFAGRQWGSNKLAPKVSPGKSWEGVIGALFTVLVYAVIGAVLLGMFKNGWFTAVMFLLLSVSTALVSVLGDLAESMFKRQVKIKDSGSLLPGHGGVMDRIDSVTAAAPWFSVGLSLLLGTQLGGMISI